MRKLIYSRKSLFTGKGESVENQIQLCMEYAAFHFGSTVEDCDIFEDEGFSAKDTERPQFQAMLQAARTGQYDCLICYRLDRVSRSVCDFSIFIEELQKLGVAFVSIREQFDTSTPMGRAMMYIASVFAQLERETLAERVRDNLYQLAKTGRWLGGVTPLGYRSEDKTSIEKGRERTQRKLVPVPQELDIVKTLFEQYLALRSLTQLDAYLLQMGVKTRNQKPFSRFAIRSILENPVYAVADQDMYSWLTQNGYEVYVPLADFNGTSGVMAYCKTAQEKHKTNQRRPPIDWIVSVGAHEGAIDGKRWIQVQDILQRNKDKSQRAPLKTDALLSGMLRCGSCGSYMRPKGGRILQDGTKAFSYVCELKERSKGALCKRANAPGQQSDAIVIQRINSIAGERGELLEKLQTEVHITEKEHQDIQDGINHNQEIIKKVKEQLKNIARAIAQNSNAELDAVLIAQAGEYSDRIQTAQADMDALERKLAGNAGTLDQLSAMAASLDLFRDSFDEMGTPLKRSLLQSIIECAVWDGEYIAVNIWGNKPLEP